MKGFEVIVATTDSIGNTAAKIKSWISNQYNMASVDGLAPSFLLLAADTDKIPCSQTGEDSGKGTDLYYACMDGSEDFVPDMYYGRFSARTAEQMKAIADKTIVYEKFQMPDSSYLAKATLIAGYDGTYRSTVGIPTLNYISNYRINSANGYDTVNIFTTSYSGCYNSSSVSVGLMNYSAHGTTTSWINPELTQATVRNFSNTGQFPFVIANCCYSGNIVKDECLGETWLRQENAGAVAYIGSSPQTWWHEDSYWAVGAHEYQAKVTPTIEECGLGAFDVPFVSDFLCGDGVIFAGNLAVTEAHDNSYHGNVSTRYYWEAYNYLGDPSLLVYFGMPTDNAVSHEMVYPIETTSVTVEALAGSYVAISKDSVLLGSAVVPEGATSATVNIPALNTTGILDVVVTKAQCKPYFGKIELIIPDRPYITLADAYTTLLENDSTRSLNIVLRNMSQKAAKNARIDSITSNSEYVKNIKPINYSIGEIDYQTKDTIAACQIDLQKTIPDQTQIPYTIVVSDSASFVLRTKVIIDAPKIEFQPDITVVSNSGNANIMPGDTAKFGITIANSGHADLSESTLTLIMAENQPFMSVSNTTCAIGNLAVGESQTCYFELSADANTEPMTDFAFRVAIANSDLSYCDTADYISTVGALYELRIGNGTSKPNNYPFNNYYECSKTDILYTTEDLGDKIMKIRSVGFDIAQATPSSENFSGLKNFTITAKRFSEASLDGFADMSDADTLYNSAIELLPTEVGLVTFELDKSYIYDGTSNFVLELKWGDNDEYVSKTNRFKVYCHNTSENTVAHGTNDNWSGLSLDGCVSVRPNTMFGYLPYNKVLIFNVTDTSGLPVANAKVSLCGETIETDSLGVANYLYCNKLYGEDCEVSENNHFSRSLKITTVDDTTRINISLIPLTVCYLSIRATDSISGGAIGGALINVEDNIISTDDDGTARMQLVSSLYQINIIADNYQPIITDISLNSDTVVIIKMRPNPSLTIRTVCDTATVANVGIVFDNDTLTVGNDGILTLEYVALGKHTITILHDDYAYENHTIAMSEYDVDTTFNLTELPNISFTVYADNILTANLLVTLDDMVQTTDSNGVATFTHVRNGKHNYTIKGNLVAECSGVITTILASTNITKRLEKSRSTLVFNVTRNGAPIQNIATEVYGQTVWTDSSGRSMFKQLVPVSNLDYTVTDGATFSIYGNVAIDRDTVFVDIDVAYMLVNITFTVTDSAGVPVVASVGFNKTVAKTDSSGRVGFLNIQRGSSLDYAVSCEGYDTVCGTLICDSAKVVGIMLGRTIKDTIPDDTTHIDTTNIMQVGANVCIYPNPTKGNFRIENDNPFRSVEIIDNRGCVVLRRDYSHGVLCADIVVSLRSGIYLVRISSDNWSVIRKLIVY